jgi:uncharacterized protein YheU (UPF0270 family)
MIIPLDRLDAETLRNIVASFVLREGTDYGIEVSFDDKINQVLSQLNAREAVLCFDQQSESINIVAKKDMHLLRAFEVQGKEEDQEEDQGDQEEE